MPQLTDDLLKVYGSPTAPDQDFFLEQLDRVIGRATEETQRKALEVILETRKSTRWPAIGEINEALQKAAATTTETQASQSLQRASAKRLVVLTPVDIQWPNWMEHLEAWGLVVVADEAKRAGQLHVPHRWPEGVGSVPYWPQMQRAQTVEELRMVRDRMTGERAE